MYILHVYPLSTHHIPSAGCSSLPFFLSKKPFAGDSQFFPESYSCNLGMRSPVKSETRLKVKVSAMDDIPQRRVGVREQGQSLIVTPHGSDTQIRSKDHCPGSACVFARLLQIHGHTLVSGSSHTLPQYILHKFMRTHKNRQISLTPALRVDAR